MEQREHRRTARMVFWMEQMERKKYGNQMGEVAAKETFL